MSNISYTITDGLNSNRLIQFVSTYFPFIDEPITMIYRGREYKILTTELEDFEFEYFFLSHNCLKCPKNCCLYVYIPIGFEKYWPKEKLKLLQSFNPRKYTFYLNNQKFIYYIGDTDYSCKYQNGKSCTIWDSNKSIQKRPMGCYFFPLSFIWDNDTLIFTKYCTPYECMDDPTRYNEADFYRDLNAFEKIIAEVKSIGFKPNYRTIDSLKEKYYLTI
ncbi:MAG: hypothetical protein EU547_00485 [Promethearchaeota archaeon]|nr:MAG: hypothetical protein EU547_00485 [Candidatus Lokiarchaeota archaeon]